MGRKFFGASGTDDAELPTRAGVLALLGDASRLVSGILASARLPFVLGAIRVGSASASLTSDASGAGMPTNIVNLTVNGNITINAPTTPADGQVMRYRCVAAGAQRTVTFAGGIVTSTGLTLGPYTVPRGAVLIAALEYVSIRTTSAGAAAPAWVLTAATVSG